MHFPSAAALLGYWVLVEKTRWGVELRAIGGNPEAAQRLGIRVSRWIVVALALGGGLAGLAGMSEVMGIHGRLRQGLSVHLHYFNPLPKLTASVLFGRMAAVYASAI